MTESKFAEELERFLNRGAVIAPNSSKDLFDCVWKIVQECGEEERHFNQLQSVYRGIASSWLLATFGGPAIWGSGTLIRVWKWRRWFVFWARSVSRFSGSWI